MLVERYLETNATVENRLVAVGLACPLLTLAEVEKSSVAQGIASTINQASARTGVSAPVKFGIAAHPRPAAYAFSPPGEVPFVLLTTGLVTGFYAAAAYLAVTGRFLVQESLPPIPPQHWPNRYFGLAHILHFEMTPISQRQRVLRDMLAATAINFVVLHELGHIINGHLASGVYGHGVIDETAPERDADVRLTRRTLEFDADAFAALHNLAISGGGASALDIHSASEAEAALCLTIAGGSIAQLFFELFDPGIEEDYRPRTHPPALIRLKMFWALYPSLYDRERTRGSNWPQMDVAEICIRMMAEREAALMAWSIPPVIEEFGIAEAMATPFLREVRARWADIRPALQAAKLGTSKLAP